MIFANAAAGSDRSSAICQEGLSHPLHRLAWSYDLKGMCDKRLLLSDRSDIAKRLHGGFLTRALQHDPGGEILRREAAAGGRDVA